MRTIIGCLLLLRLAAGSRFRLHGAYWTWRMTTAMGPDRPARRERLRNILDYARWMARMRSISR
jgi:hypothetical protein